MAIRPAPRTGDLTLLRLIFTGLRSSPASVHQVTAPYRWHLPKED
jgi:hypothetical protein